MGTSRLTHNPSQLVCHHERLQLLVLGRALHAKLHHEPLSTFSVLKIVPGTRLGLAWAEAAPGLLSFASKPQGWATFWILFFS